ncbi:L,D-transpeptidase family protein [Profundibacter sp.]|uniref:L,D-transpeptidase family protein n=1 Tax=Profundibacter sp. TaxID=3101071 RepID=UPI003D0EC0BA
MRIFKILFLITVVATLGACASKFKTYNGPEVTRVLIFKEQRKLYLMNGDNYLRAYDIELGFVPSGHKVFEGDGRTPEGEYTIDRRNPNSAFYLSIGISYPNAKDRAAARALGKSPGGDIFIHGGRRAGDPKRPDWTAGCISVSNKQMRDIYAMVKDGTPISIFP